MNLGERFKFFSLKNNGDWPDGPQWRTNRLSLLSLWFLASWLDIVQETLLVLFAGELVGEREIELAATG